MMLKSFNSRPESDIKEPEDCCDFSLMSIISVTALPYQSFVLSHRRFRLEAGASVKTELRVPNPGEGHA